MTITLTNIANVSDDATLKLGGAASVATAEVGGTAYLFAAGQIDNGVSVFSVNGSTGALTAVTNVSDDPTLQLAGAIAVATAVVGARPT